MTVPVLTAVPGRSGEAALVAALAGSGVSVVRRCLDLADLLAAASTGTARAALVSGDLRLLDRDALTRLALAGVAVVGVLDDGSDEEAERRLRQLGVDVVVDPSRGGAALVDAVHRALAVLPAPPRSAWGDPAAAATATAADEALSAAAGGSGRVVAVWGPRGAPGRSTVALALADELARAGTPALLVDADVQGGVQALLLGVLDEAPGLVAACRAASAGALDVPALAAAARTVAPRLRLLTGISRADRWPELRPAALEVVLDLGRRLGDVVVDCSDALEQDEELSYDTAAPRRHGATLAVLEAADEVLVVGVPDPVGVARLVRGLEELRERVPSAPLRVVLNRVRDEAAATEAETALARWAGVEVAGRVPRDDAALAAAVAAGRPLADVAPRSPARRALRALAGAEGAAPRRGLRRRAGA